MKHLIYILLLFISVVGLAQPPNDECQFATHLGSVSDYCSGESEFTNIEATISPQPIPFCWFGGSQNDMWFTFVPTAPGVYIQMIGATLNNPSIVVYDGDCTALNELGCASISDNNLVELSLTQLVIGQFYYLRVDARNQNNGSFQLCIKSFVPTPTPESDCKDAVVLCDKSSFQIANLDNIGEVEDELTGPCVGPGQDEERASVFYVWTCDEPGTLTFTLTPNNPNSQEEDLDFVVYEFPGGLDDCDNRIGIRCMLSGETQGQTFTQNQPCFGATGLAVGETDVSESAGCAPGDNNFVSPINMVSGVSYGLIVNNYSRSGFGFEIEFGGTGTFLGPDPDFKIEALQEFECDKSIEFTNLSSSLTDPIVSYNWNFGVGSKPGFMTGPGPHTTVFESFGDKVAALTIESSRGCTVTKIVEFFIEPCCQDTSNLSISALGTDVDCFGDEDGLILASGQAGNPVYQYAIDDGDFQLSPQFSNLPAGSYSVKIIDEKGCENITNVIIEEPGPTIANAGPDVSVDLGESGIIDASIINDLDIVDISWTPLDSFLTCIDCLNPEVLPPGQTTYTLIVTDENGCTSADEVQFLVNIVRPVFAPNIFTPNGDNVNDFFNIFGGPAVERIEYLHIYDRWGGLIYEGTPEINNRSQGWDGYVNNQLVNPGVFGWLASVRFIDDEVLPFYGDVTVYY